MTREQATMATVPPERLLLVALDIGKDGQATPADIAQGREEGPAGPGQVVECGAGIQGQPCVRTQRGVACKQVDPCAAAEAAGRVGNSGSARVAMIREQITRTLKQFPTVDEVRIAVAGETEGVLQP